MKRVLMIFGVIVLIVVTYIIYRLSTFSMFKENSAIVLTEMKVSNDYLIKIYFIPSDATIQDAIVVMKASNGNEELIKKYERYDFLESSQLIGFDSLELIMRDTSLNRDKIFKDIIALPRE